MDQKKIGKFIAECRKKKNLTQMQLAEKLNMDDSIVTKWKQGKNLPSLEVFYQLCEPRRRDGGKILRLRFRYRKRVETYGWQESGFSPCRAGESKPRRSGCFNGRSIEDFA